MIENIFSNEFYLHSSVLIIFILHTLEMLEDDMLWSSFTGEVVSIPIPHTISSIWPLPFGLLLQQELEGNSVAAIPFSSPSTLLSARSVTRSRREAGYSPPINYTQMQAFDFIFREDGASFSSHFVLKDPLEEPQVCRIVYSLMDYIHYINICHVMFPVSCRII